MYIIYDILYTIIYYSFTYLFMIQYVTPIIMLNTYHCLTSTYLIGNKPISYYCKYDISLSTSSWKFIVWCGFHVTRSWIFSNNRETLLHLTESNSHVSILNYEHIIWLIALVYQAKSSFCILSYINFNVYFSVHLTWMIDAKQHNKRDKFFNCPTKHQ